MASTAEKSSPYEWLTDDEAAEILASDPGIELSPWYYSETLSDDQMRVMQIVDSRLAESTWDDGESDDPQREAAFYAGVAECINSLESLIELHDDFYDDCFDIARDEIKLEARRHIAIHGELSFALQLAIDQARGAAHAQSSVNWQWNQHVDNFDEKHLTVAELSFIASWKVWLESIQDHQADWDEWQVPSEEIMAPILKEFSTLNHDQKMKRLEKSEQSNELFNVPGFVNEFIELSETTAPYRNIAMAFCAAITALSTLVARKITFRGLAPNIYIVGLAYSGVGKDQPRKVIVKLFGDAGLHRRLVNKFASGEGIEDKIFQENAVLFLPDEVDDYIRNMALQKDVKYTSQNEMLLTLFTTATSTFFCRNKAGKDQPQQVINNPHLSMFGTCTPSAFYESISARMMTSGLMARMLIVEAGRRGKGKDHQPIRPSESLVMAVEHYRDMPYGSGDLSELSPEPKELEATEAASLALAEVRTYADAKYDEAYDSLDAGAMAVWARCFEHVAKLAMLYAASAKPFDMVVTVEAVQWARLFVDSQIQRMLKAVSEGMHESPFDALVSRVRKKVATTKGGVTHSELLKFSRVSSKEFVQVINTLIERGEIQWFEDSKKPGPKRKLYVVAI
jgi:hypothetical protein